MTESTTSITSPDKGECAICLDMMSSDHVQLPCGHCFCTGCLQNVFDNKPHDHVWGKDPDLVCPMCRVKVYNHNLVLPTSWYTVESAPSLVILRGLLQDLDRNYGGKHKLKPVRNSNLSVRKITSSIINAINNKRTDILMWWFDKILFDQERTLIQFCELAIKCNDLLCLKIIVEADHETNVLTHLCDKTFCNETFGNDNYQFAKMDLKIYEYLYSKSGVKKGPSKYKTCFILNDVESVEKLQWWKDRFPVYHFQTVFHHHKIEVLEWWADHARHYFLHQLDIHSIIDNLSSSELLQWWSQKLQNEEHANVTFQCTDLAIQNNLRNNNMDALKWWSNSGYSLCIALELSFSNATSVEALDWLAMQIPEFKTSLSHTSILSDLLYRSCGRGSEEDDDKFFFNSDIRRQVMEWCVVHGACDMMQIDVVDSIDRLSQLGYVDDLQWWKNKKLPIQYTEIALEDASANGHWQVLQWWKDQHIPMKYTERALDYASANGHLKVLKWWKESGLTLKYTDHAFTYAIINDHEEVVTWWKELSGLFIKIDLRNEGIQNIHQESRLHICRCSGYDDPESTRLGLKRKREICEQYIY